MPKRTQGIWSQAATMAGEKLANDFELALRLFRLREPRASEVESRSRTALDALSGQKRIQMLAGIALRIR